MISIVAWCHSVKLCALAVRDDSHIERNANQEVATQQKTISRTV